MERERKDTEVDRGGKNGRQKNQCQTFKTNVVIFVKGEKLFSAKRTKEKCCIDSIELVVDHFGRNSARG